MLCATELRVTQSVYAGPRAAHFHAQRNPKVIFSTYLKTAYRQQRHNTQGLKLEENIAADERLSA